MSSRSVNSSLRYVFDEFMQNPDPYDLRPTIASLETLAVELRDSVEANNEQKRHDFYQKVAVAAAKTVIRRPEIESMSLDRDELANLAVSLSEELYESVRRSYESAFGTNLSITPEQAKVMATIVEAKGKMVERYKKMAEATTVELNYDDQLVALIVQFLSQVVIPNVSDMRERAAIATAAKAFLPRPSLPASKSA